MEPVGEPRDAAAPRLVLSTAPDRATAERIARALVGDRVVACVNLVPGVRSIYRWNGAVEEADEVLLVAKTTAARTGEVEDALRRLHPYDVPECVVLDPSAVASRYLAWLVSETAEGPPGGA